MDFELFKPIILGLLRHGLTFVAGLLVTYGVINQDQSNDVVVGLVALAFGLITMIYNKYRANQKIDTALKMKAGSTRKELKKFV